MPEKGQSNFRRKDPFSLTPLSLAFAIPDHPWVDSADGAAVRNRHDRRFRRPARGQIAPRHQGNPGGEAEFAVELAEERGVIHADLDAAVADARGPLE